MAKLDFRITKDAHRRFQLIKNITGINHQYVYLMGENAILNCETGFKQRKKERVVRIQIRIEPPVNLFRAMLVYGAKHHDSTIYETGLQAIESLMALDYAKLLYAEMRQ